MSDSSVYGDLGRPPLHVASLRRGVLGDGSLWRELQVLPTSPSTNVVVAAAARAGAAEGLVVVAEHQVAGRGRLDRVWTTPARAALTFSVLLRPQVPAARWGWLPLLTGVALAGVVRRLGEIEAVLKWPNDVLVGPDRRKVAGILAEVVDGAIVVGCGLNVSTRRDELPGADATSLAGEAAACTDRDPLLRAILRELAVEYADWQESGGDPAAGGLLAAYTAVCETVGRTVRVDLPGGTALHGTVAGVDDDGRLILATGTGRRAVAAGDVVHVRPT